MLREFSRSQIEYISPYQIYEGCLQRTPREFQMSEDHETLSSQGFIKSIGRSISTRLEHSSQGWPRYGMRTRAKRMTLLNGYLLVGLPPSLSKAVSVPGLHDGQGGAKDLPISYVDVLIKGSGALS